MKEIWNTGKKGLAVLLVGALLAGILPMQSFAVLSGTSEEGYGIKNPVTDDNGVTVWDCIYFGNYPQADTTGVEKEPIKWRVLSVDGEDAFLLADQSLDKKRYHNKFVNVTWETCGIRAWLNEQFLSEAFKSSEQGAIKETALETADNEYWNVDGGNATVDRVFLLSIEEVLTPVYGFTSEMAKSDTRIGINTVYAGGSDAVQQWWLRTPGSSNCAACFVSPNGFVSRQYSYDVGNDYVAVRPALHINLSFTSEWDYAGTVGSDGTIVTPAPSETKEPSASVSPNVPTQLPEESKSPVASAEPTQPASSQPVVTEEPSETTQPMASPVATVSPVVSAEPTQPASSQPNVTSEPSETTQPMTSPVATVSPVSAPGMSMDKPAVSPSVSTRKPSKVSALKVQAKKKDLRVSWKKVTEANGYEIWYSTSKKWEKKKRKLTKNTAFYIRKCKKRRTYYVKVRAYTMQNGKKVVGAWSKTVKKKIK